MTQPISGCLTEKQVLQLNDKLHSLSFQFGTVLDEAFAKIITASFNLCDAADIPQNTAGEEQFLCIVDGVCSFVDKRTVVDLNETLTVLSFDPATCTISYTDENAVQTDIALPQAPLPVYDVPTRVLSFEDAKGNQSFVTLPGQSVVTNTIAAGNLIATHQDGTGVSVDVLESVTTLIKDPTTCTAEYISEDGTTTTIQEFGVSADAGNSLVLGTDNKAFVPPTTWAHTNFSNPVENFDLTSDHFYRAIATAGPITFNAQIGTLTPGDRFIVENAHTSTSDLTFNYINPSASLIDGTVETNTLILEPGCAYTFSRESGNGIKITSKYCGEVVPAGWTHVDYNVVTQAIALAPDHYYRNAFPNGVFNLSIGTLTPGDRFVVDNNGTLDDPLTLNYTSGSFVDGTAVTNTIILDPGCIYTFTRQAGNALTVSSAYCGPSPHTNDLFKELDQYALIAGAVPAEEIEQRGYTTVRLNDTT